MLKYDRLVEIAELIHRYFLDMETIGSFARVTDITLKTDEELAALHEAGQGGYLVTVFLSDRYIRRRALPMPSSFTLLYRKIKMRLLKRLTGSFGL